MAFPGWLSYPALLSSSANLFLRFYSYSVNLVVPRDKITIQGETKKYGAPGTSGNEIVREFCPTCGSPVRSISVAKPESSFLKGCEFPMPL